MSLQTHICMRCIHLILDVSIDTSIDGRRPSIQIATLSIIQVLQNLNIYESIDSYMYEMYTSHTIKVYDLNIDGLRPSIDNAFGIILMRQQQKNDSCISNGTPLLAEDQHSFKPRRSISLKLCRRHLEALLLFFSRMSVANVAVILFMLLAAPLQLGSEIQTCRSVHLTRIAALSPNIT